MDRVTLLGYMAVIVIVVSFLGMSFELTGLATSDTAVVNVTVETSASINFTDDFVDFGSGQVNTSGGYTYAILDSNDTSAGVNGNWSWSADYFTLENNGNVNVTLNLTAGKNADTFLGGSNPAYNFSIKDGESGSCTNSSYALDAWLPADTTPTTICDPLKYTDTSDLINISVKLVIPSDSYTGQLTDTFTAEATAAP